MLMRPFNPIGSGLSVWFTSRLTGEGGGVHMRPGRLGDMTLAALGCLPSSGPGFAGGQRAVLGLLKRMFEHLSAGRCDGTLIPVGGRTDGPNFIL